jgi:hypothetical protein
MPPPRLLQQLRSGPPAAPAFGMPLAVGATGILLLLSLALHGVAMQEWLQVGALMKLRHEEDLLASGAHQLLAALNGPHRCLLALPLARWEAEGGACASPAAVAALKEAQVLTVSVRLLAWEPQGAQHTAAFELSLEGAAGRAARRGRFGARLAGVPPQAVDLRPRSLAGALP